MHDTTTAPAVELSERALVGALLQDFDRVFPVVQAAGVTAESFNDEICRKTWRITEGLRSRRGGIVTLETVCETWGGDPAEALDELGPLVENAPVPAMAAHYAERVRAAQQRRELHTAARMAVEALSRGDAAEDVAAQLKAASEAVGGEGCGPEIAAARDFMAEPIPEPPEVIKKLLRAGQVGLIASTSKAGKTWLVQSLGLSVPSGRDWLGWKTTPGRVLLVDPELQPYDGQTRLNYLADALGLKSIPEALDLWRVKGVTLGISDMIPKILRRQEQVGEPYALILLDSIYCLNGGRDENDNTEQAKTMQELYALTAQTGAAVLVTHHFSKGNKSMTDHLDRASGAGVFARAPDVFMTLTPHQEADCYAVETTCRSFAKPDPFVARWDFPLWSRADELDPERLKRHGAGRGAQFTTEQIMALLPEEGLPHHEWMNKAKSELGCGKTTFNNLLGKAKADGLAVCGFGRYVAGSGAE